MTGIKDKVMMGIKDIVMMPIQERARRLVGDMPWITGSLDDKTLKDMVKQIEACITAAVIQDRHTREVSK